MNTIDLKNRVAVITGGAQGIGFAIPIDEALEIVGEVGAGEAGGPGGERV